MDGKRVKALYRRTGGAAPYDRSEADRVKDASRGKTDRPCRMPVRAMDGIVGVLPGGVQAIDPFRGSGTTGVACAGRGMEFVGIDMDERYAEIARERIERQSQFTKTVGRVQQR